MHDLLYCKVMCKKEGNRIIVFSCDKVRIRVVLLDLKNRIIQGISSDKIVHSNELSVFILSYGHKKRSSAELQPLLTLNLIL